MPSGTAFTGSITTLGFEFPAFACAPEKYFHTFMAANEEESLGIFRKCGKILGFLVGARRIHVLEGSALADVLREQGHDVTVVPDAFRVILDPEKVLVIDSDDFASDDIQLMLKRSSFNTLPCNILTAAHVCMYAENMDYFNRLSMFVKAVARSAGKRAVFVSMSFGQDLIGSILLLLNAAGAVASMMMSGCHGRDGQCHIGGIHALRNLDPATECAFIFNDCSIAPLLRDFLSDAGGMTYFFLFGEPRRLPLEKAFHEPFLLWFYPYSGSARMNPVFSGIFQRLGLQNVLADHFSDPAGKGDFSTRRGRFSYTAGLIEHLHDALPANSYVSFHGSHYDDIGRIMGLNRKILVFMRDYRDILISFIRNTFLNVICSGKRSLEDVALDVLDGGLPGFSVDRATENLVSLAEYGKSVFIRFEDVNRDPVRPYVEALSKLGFGDDPFLVRHRCEEWIRQLSGAHAPDSGRGKSGTWEGHFTPAMKESFKRHTNGILQVFGYERDDGW